MSKIIEIAKIWLYNFFHSTRIKSLFVPLTVIVVALILYNYFWDVIAGAKIMALSSPPSATVWDMGAFYGRIWASVHSQTVNNFLFDVGPSPITLILSPLLYFKNPFLFAYLQTAWISLTAVPIYFISSKKLQSKAVSLILSISLLLFFGIAGLNWFDIHFQTLFLPLFTTGVCLFYYEKYKSSAIFMILAGSVHYLFMIFPILFYLIYFIEKIVVTGRIKVTKRSMVIPALVGVIFLIVSIYVNYHILGTTNIASSAHIHGNMIDGILSKLESGSIDNEFMTFFLYLGPFMMLPLLSKRWIPSIMVFLVLLFFSGESVFYFPYGLNLVEQTMLIPFLYLGTIDVLEPLYKTARDDRKEARHENVPKENVIIKEGDKNGALKFVIVMFILIVLLGTVYEPYGPLDKYSQADFGLASVLDYNSTLYDAFNSMVKLIPENDPYVLYQNNMPEVVFHDPSTLTGFLFGYSNNFTYPLGTSYTKPFWSGNIQYVIADPYSGYFLTGGSGNFSLNMYTTLQHFISQRGYGIEAEYDGLILLKKGFSGNPVIYGPENRMFLAKQLYNVTYENRAVSSSYYGNDTIYTDNAISHQTIWYGPYTFLQPGTYKVKLELKVSNTSSHNYFNLRFSYFDTTNDINLTGPIIASLTNITGADVPVANSWTNVTVSVVASNFLELVEFAGQNFYWYGNFSIRQITVIQTVP